MSATMIKEFRLPDLGEGLTESEILSWKVGVGDTVSLNQVIAEVETAKAVVELPSPFAGVIKELHEQPGTVVEVGKPIVSFEVADDAGQAPSGGTGETASESASGAPKREPNLVGYGAVVESTGRPARRLRNFQAFEPAEASPVETRPSVAEPAEAHPAGTTADRPRSTPPVRKLAKDLGVDLADVAGTGPQGLITREDVQHFVDGKSPDAGAGHEAATPAAAARPGGR
jgi:2-oxoisovalerate dehydrogenase E2 component (dihydrolipoyl transacylase)